MIARVEQTIRQAATTTILPYYQRLAEADVIEKSPGELVTAADRATELILSERLTDLLPGSLVVGEESVADDPAVLERLSHDGPVWLIDPLDGTRNFTEGHGPFAIMVALLQDGETRASWIYDPLAESMAIAELGSGAYVDGVRVRSAQDELPVGRIAGAVFKRYLPPDMRSLVEAREPVFAAYLPGSYCAGYEYPAVVRGEEQFVLWWRTLPWDHVPGSLFATEAGAVVRRLDGSLYHIADGKFGLLVAQNEAIWRTVRRELLPI